MKVVCITKSHPRHYRIVARSMCVGIRRCGDDATIVEEHFEGVKADVGVMYGWKLSNRIKRFDHYVYADLGYWKRDQYYRISVDGWSPDRYVMQGRDAGRRKMLGVEIKDWNTNGTEILIAGSKAKACRDHDLRYMEWETKTATLLSTMYPGEKIVYRPKPNDQDKRPMNGFAYDQRPLEEALRAAKIVVTHHSNIALDALAAGVPVHCEIGAAAACSVDKLLAVQPPRLEHRVQFINDAAWLQWSREEMESGECWSHLKERGLLS